MNWPIDTCKRLCAEAEATVAEWGYDEMLLLVEQLCNSAERVRNERESKHKSQNAKQII